MKILFLIALIALLISVATAHHSVRVKKPETEEERMAHHLLHRRQPRKEITDEDESIRHQNKGDGTSLHKGLPKSSSYHFKVGPEYPDHSKRRRDYKVGGGSSIPMSAREAERERREREKK